VEDSYPFLRYFQSLLYLLLHLLVGALYLLIGDLEGLGAQPDSVESLRELQESLVPPVLDFLHDLLYCSFELLRQQLPPLREVADPLLEPPGSVSQIDDPHNL